MPRSDTKSRGSQLTIGALADRTRVNVETIRYYERIGLLPSPPRSAGRHRLYEDLHYRRLAFIRRARELGFSQSDVRMLLGLGAGHGLTCEEVRELTEVHLAAIRDKIRDLRRLERILSGLAARCRSGTVPDCPILEALGSVD